MVEDIDGEIDEVVVVEGIVLELQPHVSHQHVGAFGRARRQEMALDVGVDVVALERGHLGEETLGGELAAVDAELLHGLLGELLGVFLVYHRETLGIADAVDLAAQELDAETVDGADEVVDAAAVNHSRYAPLHLLGGLVGEREAKDVSR